MSFYLQLVADDVGKKCFDLVSSSSKSYYKHIINL